jgi:hypothetical protein
MSETKHQRGRRGDEKQNGSKEYSESIFVRVEMGKKAESRKDEKIQRHKRPIASRRRHEVTCPEKNLRSCWSFNVRPNAREAEHLGIVTNQIARIAPITNTGRADLRSLILKLLVSSCIQFVSDFSIIDQFSQIRLAGEPVVATAIAGARIRRLSAHRTPASGSLAIRDRAAKLRAIFR